VSEIFDFSTLSFKDLMVSKSVGSTEFTQ
jgi:hypothetical protein